MTICYSDRAMDEPETEAVVPDVYPMSFEHAVGVLTLTLVSDHASPLPAHIEEAVKAAVQPQHRICHEDARLCPHCTLDSIMRELFNAMQLPVM